MQCSLVPAGSHPCSARVQQNLQVSKNVTKNQTKPIKKKEKEKKEKKEAVLKMIPNTTSVPDFKSLQHRPRKCKLLWSELVGKYSPEGIQFSVLAESFKSLNPAPWVSALEAFIHGQGEEKQGLYRWCPGALTENSTAEYACPSSLRPSEGTVQIEDTHCKQALGKEK